jgi:carbonic anhydrase
MANVYPRGFGAYVVGAGLALVAGSGVSLFGAGSPPAKGDGQGESKPAAKPVAPARPMTKPITLAVPAAKQEKHGEKSSSGARPGAGAKEKEGRDAGHEQGHGQSQGDEHAQKHDDGEQAGSQEQEKVRGGGASNGELARMSEAMAQRDLTKDADWGLAALVEGNERWVSGRVANPSISLLRRQETATSGQKPFVTVLTCADSRIPVERVFDRGVGEVFVIRVAGNVIGPHEAGTIEYGLEHLHTPLLVVMGHTKCGAVKAAVENEGKVGGNIDSLIDNIRPAVARAKKLGAELQGDELVVSAVRENVWQSIFDLYKSSPAILELAQSGKVKVVGAVMDISTGSVEWLGEHPWQDAILTALTAPAKEGKGQVATERASVPTEEKSGH